jgi:hypothetical protein
MIPSKDLCIFLFQCFHAGDRIAHGALFYLATRFTLHADSFAWRQAAYLSSLFRFALSRGPRVLVECIAVNIWFLIAIFKGDARHNSFSSQTLVAVCYTLKFYNSPNRREVNSDRCHKNDVPVFYCSPRPFSARCFQLSGQCSLPS